MSLSNSLPVFILLVALSATLWRGRVLKKRNVIAYGFGYRPEIQSAAEKFWKLAVGLTALVALQGWLWPQAAQWLGRPDWADMQALRAASALMLVMGLLLIVMAQVQMGLSWRVGVPAEGPGALVTHGLFAISRNPIFVGMFLIVLGVFLSNPHLLSSALPPLAAAMMSIQVRVEEEALTQKHPLAYQSYRDRTPRWIWPLK